MPPDSKRPPVKGAGTTINAVVVPVAFTINGTVFDPTMSDTCDSVRLRPRLYYSPLVQSVSNLTINGVNFGTTQFINGFRRAEFWGTFGKTRGEIARLLRPDFE